MGKYRDAVLADSPVRYYRLGDATSTAVEEISGANGTYVNTPTLGATSLVQSETDTAVTFTKASSEYVTCGTALVIADTFTFELWVQRAALGGDEVLISIGGSGTAQIKFLGATNQVYLLSNLVGYVGTSLIAIADTTTAHHVVVTKTGAATKFYIDGVASTSALTNQTMVDDGNATLIGARSGTNDLTFGGTLDEVAIYDTVLPADRVLAHYRAGFLERSETIFTTSQGAGVAPVSAASSWGFGSYVPLATHPYKIALSGFSFEPPTPATAVDTTDQRLFEIATGAPSAETVIAQIPYSVRQDTNVGYVQENEGRVFLPEPIELAAGTRLSVRVADSSSSALTYSGFRATFREMVSATAGSGAATVSVTGVATGTERVNASGAATVSVTGVATGKEIVNASGAGTVTVTGVATGTERVNATGAATVAVTGDATGSQYRTGSGEATVQVTGDATGKATANGAGQATVQVTGTATGLERVNASGEALVQVTADAIGKETVNASGQAQVTVTGDASGTERVHASGEALVQVTGAATGTERVHGTGEASVQVTGTATGRAVVHGSGEAQVTVTADATKEIAGVINGSGEATVNVTGAATGKATVNGSGAGSVAVSADATGTARVQATGSASVSVTGAASGSVVQRGTGESSVLVTGTATGIARVFASGQATVTVTANATGYQYATSGSGEATVSVTGTAVGTVIRSDLPITNVPGEPVLVSAGGPVRHAGNYPIKDTTGLPVKSADPEPILTT